MAEVPGRRNHLIYSSPETGSQVETRHTLTQASLVRSETVHLLAEVDRSATATAELNKSIEYVSVHLQPWRPLIVQDPL